MAFPLIPVAIAGGLGLVALALRKPKAVIAKAPSPRPATRPAAVPVVAPTNFAPSPPPPQPVVAPGTKVETKVGDVIFTSPAAIPPPPVMDFKPSPTAVDVAPVAVTGVARTPTQSADFEKTKRSTKEYYKWAQDALNKSVPVANRTNKANLDVDGAFGPKSKQMTKDFQNMVNKEFAARGMGTRLVVDGVIGENTEAQLVQRPGVSEPPWAKQMGSV